VLAFRSNILSPQPHTFSPNYEDEVDVATNFNQQLLYINPKVQHNNVLSLIPKANQ